MVPHFQARHWNHWGCTKKSHQANTRFQGPRVSAKTETTGPTNLTYRRLRGDMIETFKIVNGHYDQEVAPELPKGNSTTRGHNKKLFKKRASRLNCRKHFFTLRVVSTWNALPEEVVNAKTVDAFKRRLDRHWKDHPSKCIGVQSWHIQ